MTKSHLRCNLGDSSLAHIYVYIKKIVNFATDLENYQSWHTNKKR
jgi:hypothetical protein